MANGIDLPTHNPSWKFSDEKHEFTNSGLIQATCLYIIIIMSLQLHLLTTLTHNKVHAYGLVNQT